MREPYYIIIAFALGFIIAQLWKFVAGVISGHERGKKRSFKEMIGYITRSGGMPSGHAASMFAATTVAAMGAFSSNAFGSWFGNLTGVYASGSAATAFFVLLCVDFIVLYDAVNVRKAVGEQGKALNEILKKQGKKPLRVVEGHTVAEVVVGAILGIVVGSLMMLVAQHMGLPMPWYGG